MNNRGQFIPITAMVLFTTAVFMIAVVNIYAVSRAKLQVQNLADAAALNLAAQQAQAYNLVADKNEYMNHMMTGYKSPFDPEASQGEKDCSIYAGPPGEQTPVPGIHCVENRGPEGETAKLWKAKSPVFGRHIFGSIIGVQDYGMVVFHVNQAQRMFIKAYNSFLGATVSANVQGSNAAPTNFEALLKKDIPALEDPSITMVAWNKQNRKEEAESLLNSKDDLEPNEPGGLFSKLEPLSFEVQENTPVCYYTKRGSPFALISRTQLGEALFECPKPHGMKDKDKVCGPLMGTGESYRRVGKMTPIDTAWDIPPQGPMPRVDGPGGPKAGVGVMVSKRISLPVLGGRVVKARSMAYIIESGGSGEFKPTYWVKLGK